MTTITALFLLSFGLATADCAPAPAWELTAGLSAPESAYAVPGRDWLLISNVAGAPDGKDGHGWLSQVGLDGKMMTAQWVAGMNAPKGMRASGGLLYVADIDELVEIDIASADVVRRIAAPGAKMLNDVAVDDEGRVFVSDTMGSRIYVLSPEGLTVWLEGPSLASPNGLAVRGGKLFVAAWGAGMKPDWSTTSPGSILSFDLKTKKRRAVSKPIGNLDGLEWDGKGWLVSDWVAGKVHRFAGGKAKLLLEGFKGAADLGWIEKGRLLVLPRMGEDRVSAYKL